MITASATGSSTTANSESSTGAAYGHRQAPTAKRSAGR